MSAKTARRQELVTGAQPEGAEKEPAATSRAMRLMRNSGPTMRWVMAMAVKAISPMKVINPAVRA